MIPRAGVVAVVLALAGCSERELTEADCALVKDRLQAAWKRDALAAQDLAETDQFLQFIKDEGERIGESWMQRCKTMVGKQVSEAELSCLTAAETIDDVYACTP